MPPRNGPAPPTMVYASPVPNASYPPTMFTENQGESLPVHGGDESDKCYLTESYTTPGIAPRYKPIA